MLFKQLISYFETKDEEGNAILRSRKTTQIIDKTIEENQEEINNDDFNINENYNQDELTFETLRSEVKSDEKQNENHAELKENKENEAKLLKGNEKLKVSNANMENCPTKFTKCNEKEENLNETLKIKGDKNQNLISK